MYNTPHVRNNVVHYTHEIELKNEFQINQISFNNWSLLEKLLSKNQGISLSLEPFLIKEHINKKNQIITNRVKQVKKKIFELYESLKLQYLINSKNLDVVD
jgi:hypothetical protein